MEFFKQILHCENGERKKKEIIVKELEAIYKRISEVDSSFEDVIEKLKMNLGEFLSHFYEMPKLPEKVDGANEEEYNKLMTIYKTEMKKKIEQVEMNNKEMNYNGGYYNELYLLSDDDFNVSYGIVISQRFASKKMIADFGSFKCMCGLVGYKEETCISPFYLFEHFYSRHV